MSKWTEARNAAEAWISKAFHVGAARLQPIAVAVGKAAAPLVEDALLTAGKAIAEAAANGTAHGSHDMINVGLKSLRDQAPHLEATVSTAIVAAAVQHAAQHAAQEETPLPAGE